eukprot:1160277-Pelagomonas_calceolata.AAC.26
MTWIPQRVALLGLQRVGCCYTPSRSAPLKPLRKRPASLRATPCSSSRGGQGWWRGREWGSKGMGILCNTTSCMQRAKAFMYSGHAVFMHAACVFMPASSFVEACSIACASSMRMLSPGSSPNSCHSAEDAVTWELPPLMHAHVGRPAGTQATYEDHGELEPNPNKPDMPTVLTFGGITDALLASFKQCISDLATSS